jgi:beta-lactamase class D
MYNWREVSGHNAKLAQARIDKRKKEIQMRTPRRTTPFLGEQDTAKIVWSSKTHSSTSEAFRDADYATPIWRCKTDFDRTMDYLGWIVMWIVTLGALYLFATAFNAWAK